MPLDEKKVKQQLAMIKEHFWWKRSTFVVYAPTLTRALNAQVYASCLYNSGLENTDYDRLDQIVVEWVRTLYNLPPTTPTAFIRWELRLVHTDILSVKSTLKMIQSLRSTSIIGRHILDPTVKDHVRQEKPLGPILDQGPMGRAMSALHDLYEDRVRVGAIASGEPAVLPGGAVAPRDPVDPTDPVVWGQMYSGEENWGGITEAHANRTFVARLDADISHTTGLSPAQQQHLRAAIHLPHRTSLSGSDSKVEDGLTLNPATPRRYFYLGGELAVAGLRFRALSIGHHLRDEPRESCEWCDEEDAEHGLHLLARCPAIPPGVEKAREQTLRSVLAEHHSAPGNDHPAEETWDATTNIARLYNLEWEGMSTTTTRRVLRYMRDAIRAYCDTARDRMASDAGEGKVEKRSTICLFSIPCIPDTTSS